MELNDVLESKIYVKERSGAGFLSPKEYLEPFIEKVGDAALDFTVRTTEPVVNKDPETGEENIAYPRVLIEAKIGRNIEGFDSVIGLVYALDMQQPVMKVYTGENVRACTNLTIFNAQYLFSQSLLGNYQEIYNKAQFYMENKQKEVQEFQHQLEMLNGTILNQTQISEWLGYLLRKSNSSKIGSGPIIGAAKSIGDNKSRYFVAPDGRCNLFHLYNAVTQGITDSKEILDKAQKTISLSRLFFSEGRLN
jgi:hypothetical protein